MNRLPIRRIVLIPVIVFLVSATITTTLVFAQIVPDAQSGNLTGTQGEPLSYNWSWTLETGGTLQVDLTSVNVEIKPHNGDQITAAFEGSAIRDSKGNLPQITANLSGNTIYIREEERNGRSFQISLISLGPTANTGSVIRGRMEILVPRDLVIQLETSLYSGNTEVADIEVSGVNLSTTSGQISAKNLHAAGNMSFHTFSGNVDLFDLGGKECEITTSSGSASVEKLVFDSLTHSQFSGSLNMSDARFQNDAKMDSSSGDVTIEGITARNVRINGFSSRVNLVNGTVDDLVSVTTSNGDIRCQNLQAQAAAFEVFSGSITGENLDVGTLKSSASSGNLRANLLRGAHVDCTSFSGKVDLTTPQDYGFTVKVDTFSGATNIGYPVTISGSMDSQKGISGTVGNGEYSVKIETSSGDVTIGPGGLIITEKPVPALAQGQVFNAKTAMIAFLPCCLPIRCFGEAVHHRNNHKHQ